MDALSAVIQVLPTAFSSVELFFIIHLYVTDFHPHKSKKKGL